MSSLLTFVGCPEIQDELDNYFCRGMEPLPISTFLFSDENRARILKQTMVPGDGKLRQVVLTYFRRVLESEVNDYVSYACEAGTKRGNTSKVYDLDEHEGVEIARRISILDLIRTCQSNAGYRAQFLGDLVDGLDRKIETQAAQKLAALVGAYSVKDKNPDGSAIGSSTKLVKTILSAANPTQHYNAHEAIMQTARLNNYCSAPVVIGEYEIANYYRRNQLAGCCADIGIDFGALTRSAPVVLPSYRMSDALLDADKFITLSLGAALPVWFNLYEGPVNELNDESNFAGMITSPRTGIDYNLRVTRVCDDWDFNLSLPWELFGAPTDMFENSDPQDGNVFIHKYEVSNS